MGLRKFVKRCSFAVMLLLGVMAAGDVAEAAVSVSGTTIELNGQSVVIKGSADNTMCSIYADDNRDGIADSSTPIRINNATSYDLSNYTIYGYKSSSTTLTNDLSIRMEGGTVNNVYGIFGQSSSKSVSITVTGGIVKSNVIPAYNANVLNASLVVTGGTFKSGCKVKCCLGSSASGNVELGFTGTAVLENGMSGAITELMAASGGNVAGDVNVTFGNTSAKAAAGSYVNFYACSAVTVNGNLNVTLDGYWNNSSDVQLVATGTKNESTLVKGDLNLNWVNGEVTPKLYCLYDGELKGSLNASVAGIAGTKGSLYILKDETAEKTVSSADIDISAGSGVSYTYLKNLNCTGFKCLNNKGILTLSGVSGTKYTINEDKTYSLITVDSGIECIVKEGATLTIAGSANISEIKGILTNNGTVKYSGGGADQYMLISGKLTNRGEFVCAKTTSHKAILRMNGVLDNYGTITSDNNFYIGFQGCTSAIGNNYGTITNTYSLGINGILNNYGTVKTREDNSSSNIKGLNLAGTINNKSDGKLCLNSIVNNTGKIVNYGTIEQNYDNSVNSKVLGTIYTTRLIGFKKAASLYSGTNSQIYYKINLDYSSKYTDDPQITGAEGEYIAPGTVIDDNNAYMLAGKTFNVSIGTLKSDDYKLESVTYGSEETAATKSGDVYTGTMGYEPTTVSLNFGNAGTTVTNITLDKTSDYVMGLKVGENNSCFYDLKTLKVSNDSGSGNVSYRRKEGYALPPGLSMNDGKISGTPTTANYDETKVVFVVTGVNGTSAEFTLTFGPVAKGDVSLALPTGLKSTVGKTLGSISLPVVDNGTYKWQNENTVLNTYSTTGVNYYVCFTPKDKDNYNWAGANVTTNGTKTTFTYSNGVLTAQVKVIVDKGIPEYKNKIPSGLTATYGQTLGNITLPSDNDGKFVWQESASTPVGTVGRQSHKANYIPKNSGYVTVEDIVINVQVNKAQPTFYNSISKPQTVSAVYGDKLKNINLPTVTGGTYKWITSEETLAEDGKTYVVGYKPADTENYDWTGLSGWNRNSGCVQFNVTAKVAKAKPQFSQDLLFNTLSTTYGNRLQDIPFPVVSQGSYKWISDKTAIAKRNTAYRVGYCPVDTVHYDWTQISGWNSAQNCVEFTVNINVASVAATFTDAMRITAFSENLVYGDTLADINLPNETAGGKYVWVENVNTKVVNGVAYVLSYVPNDTVYYDWSGTTGWNSSLKRVEWPVTFSVAKATPAITKSPVSITASEGQTLSTYASELPIVKNGEWYKGNDKYTNAIVSAAGLPNGRIEFNNPDLVLSTSNARDVKITFIPEDTDNYETVEMGIFIIINHAHTFSQALVYDNDKHWNSCEYCGASQNEEDHNMVVKTQNDEKTIRECSICKRTEEQVHRYITQKDDTYHWESCRDCSYNKLKELHEFGEWEQVDENSHTRICECGYRQTANHNWDEGAEVAGGIKVKTCVDCGATDIHEHDFGSWTKVDDNKHKRTCKDSGCGHTEERDHDWGLAEETGSGTVRSCVDCNATESHEHSFGELVMKDVNTHWRRCDCGATIDEAEHTYGDWVKKDNSSHWKQCECGAYISEEHVWDDGEETIGGRIKFTCEICGDISEHYHEYTNSVYDEESHWKECECGSVSDLEEHYFEDWEYDDDKHWQSCDCGYMFEGEHRWAAGEANEDGDIEYICRDCGMTTLDPQDSHVHNYGDWEKDEKNHWHVCVCGDQSLPESHDWDEGSKTADNKIVFVCKVCGFERTEDLPPIAQNPDIPVTPVSNSSVPVGERVIDDSKNVSVKVTNAGTVDANGKLVGAEAAFTGPVNKTKKVIVPDVVYDKSGNPYTVTSIAANAFKNDKTVTTIKIGGSVTTIGNGAFSGCVKLKTITIGKNVTAIGDKAFNNCKAITKVEIPANIQKIGKQAFADCKKLKKITIKSTKLTKISANAFKGINKKAVFKVPKKKLKAYKKLFKSSAGFKKTMKIKA